MKRTHPAWLVEYPIDPAIFRHFSEERGLWYESPAEILDALEYGREKARLLRWVRRHMGSRLTARERYCVDLLFFQGLTYRQASEEAGVDPAVVFRTVQRGLVKLRRQLANRRTRSRLRVTRFTGAVEDAPGPEEQVY